MSQQGSLNDGGTILPDIETLTGDVGGIIGPDAAFNIDLLGGTNINTAGAANAITFNLDGAITLATSVTSPLYTSAAGVDTSITAPGGQEIVLQLGDAAGATTIDIEDSASATIASIDSNGTATFVNLDSIIGSTTPAAGTFTTLTGNTSVTSPIFTTAAGSDTNINAVAGQDIIIQMGDAVAANKVSFEDSASAEVSSIDSNGNSIFVNCNATTFDTNVAAAAVTLTGTTLSADGTDANIDVTITPKGTGDVIMSSVDINGGNVDGTIIGSASTAAGTFTDLEGTSIISDPQAATDAFIQFDESSVNKWRIGNDATDDSFRISQGVALGTNDTFVMTSAGELTMPLQPAFLATQTAAQANLPINTTTTLTINNEIYDQNADYNNGTYTFTAPITGKYFIQATVRLANADTANIFYNYNITTSNRTFTYLERVDQYGADPSFISITNSVLADMDASDTALVSIFVSNAGANQADVDTTDGVTYFSGNLSC